MKTVLSVRPTSVCWLMVFESGTDPMSLFILFSLFLCLLGWCSSKKAYGSIVSNWIGMKFGWIILHLNVRWSVESEFGVEANLSGMRWRPWRQPAACCCIRWLPASSLSACDIIGSLYVLQFLIPSTFVLLRIMFSVYGFVIWLFHGAW